MLRIIWSTAAALFLTLFLAPCALLLCSVCVDNTGSCYSLEVVDYTMSYRNFMLYNPKSLARISILLLCLKILKAHIEKFHKSEV